jgi:hypothetical protein
MEHVRHEGGMDAVLVTGQQFPPLLDVRGNGIENEQFLLDFRRCVNPWRKRSRVGA